MTDFRTYYDKMMKVSDEERIRLAKSSLKSFKDTAKLIHMDNEAVNTLVQDFLRLFICADKKTGGKERAMFSKLMGQEYSKEEFMEIIQGSTKTVFRIQMKDKARHLSPNMKVDMMNIAAAVLCCDNELGEEEEALMNEIFN